jgi:hypothetical protein
MHVCLWMRAHPKAYEGRMSSREVGIYSPSNSTTATIPTVTNATKIMAPATTLLPVSK